jgi:hypothetical protein
MRSKTSLAGLLLALALSGSPAQAGDMAVVVHPKVSVSDLSFAELRKVLLGDRQFWSPNEPITLLVRAPTAPERTILLEKIYDMTEAQFKQYWVAKVFRAETASGPKIVISTQMAMGLVEAIEGSVALVDVKDVKPGMKVLKINGILPGAKGYPLR